MPELKKGWPTGMLGLRPDKEGNLWLGMMYQGAIAKFDIKDKKITTWSMPPEMNKDQTQVNMVRAEQAHVDGKVWSQNNGFAAIHRLDLKTGAIERRAVQAAGVGRPITSTTSSPTPRTTPTSLISRPNISARSTRTRDEGLSRCRRSSPPRRGMMDEQTHWFGEYRGNRIGMFDTKTEKVPGMGSADAVVESYDVALDKNGAA